MHMERSSLSTSATVAAILAGGLGTRLRTVVPDRPKSLAQVAGRVFIKYVLDQLCASPVSHVVLCTGYLGDVIERDLGNVYGSLPIVYSHEPVALGTGGALRLALPSFHTRQVLVLNGDSFCEVNIGELLRAHRERRASITMVVTSVADNTRYGGVVLEDDRKIVSFKEKGREHGQGWVNAGVYVIDHAVIRDIPAGRPVSLEKDVFPHYMGRSLHAFPTEGPFIDIGVPIDYERAQKLLSRIGATRFGERKIS